MDKREDENRLRELLESAKRIVVICHSNPDGDAVGALLGLGLLIERAMPNREVRFFCKDPPPATLCFLPGSSRVQTAWTAALGDVFVFVDTAEAKLTGLVQSHPQLFDGTYPTACIDHHPMNAAYTSVSVIVPDACSSCEIIVALADHFGWTLDADTATCLLAGVYTDTGGLLHSNTTAAVYRTVAALLRAGARQQEIVRAIFRTAKPSTLKLWGRVLEKITLTEEGGAISAITEGDFRATGAHHSELTGAIDYVNAVPGMRFSLILSERSGTVKGSLRTLREDVDVSAMAGKLSGGGHRKAAGFSLPGKLQPEVRWKVVGEGAKSEGLGIEN
ncbi:MAG: DHH family phosphoesterase [Candidatus Peregrinibacteria bacterium]